MQGDFGKLKATGYLIRRLHKPNSMDHRQTVGGHAASKLVHLSFMDAHRRSQNPPGLNNSVLSTT